MSKQLKALIESVVPAIESAPSQETIDRWTSIGETIRTAISAGQRSISYDGVLDSDETHYLRKMGYCCSCGQYDSGGGTLHYESRITW
jgi:hypothetical protein